MITVVFSNCLSSLINLLPLMYWLEIADVLFFMKSLRGQKDSFNVLDYVAFTSSRTRSGNRKKLWHKYVTGFGKTSLKKDENYFSYDQI